MTDQTIYLVTFTRGAYSDTCWFALRAFTERDGPDGADAFVAECERIYEAAKARNDDPDDAFDFDGSKETGWKEWIHPLVRNEDVWNAYMPRWAVEAVAVDGLWWQLVPPKWKEGV